LDIKDLLKSN